MRLVKNIIQQLDCLVLPNKLGKTSESSEYRAWRDRFIRQRLKVCLFLALPCLLTFIFYDGNYFGFDLNPWIEADIARVVFLLIGVVLYHSPWGKENPEYLLFWASGSITTFPSLWMMLRGQPTVSVGGQNLVLITQTAFLPMYWRVHAVSQMIGILVALIAMFLAGGSLKTLDNLGLPLIYWLWLYFICILAVYLYERLQQQEFEIRRELNIFLHAVSHDLLAPVTGTSMVLNNLLKKAEGSEQKILLERSILERLLQGSDRQLSMINSLLEAQSVSQGMTLTFQECELSQLIASIALELEPILAQNRVVVNNRTARNLPLVKVDPLQLRRVFNNLILNAVKHNPHGIELTIDVVTEERQVRIYIADNGMGIPLEQQQHLFELYTKGKRAKFMPGIGMGLYLCQQIVLAHDGEIGFDSYPDQGSTFWFTLPMS